MDTSTIMQVVDLGLVLIVLGQGFYIYRLQQYLEQEIDRLDMNTYIHNLALQNIMEALEDDDSDTMH